MPQWYDALFELLAAQPAETTRVTIPLADVAVRVGAPIPDAVYARSWWSGTGGGALRRRIRATGWWVARMHEGVDATITFERLSPAAPEDV